jgi:ERCC4-type nuclease
VKTLTLVVDNLAASSFVTEQLRDRGVRIVESNLKFGQYRVTDLCTVWHLTAAELAHMAAERTIYRKIPEFKRSTPEPIIIVDGDPMAVHEKISTSGMRAAFTFLALHNRIPVLTAKDASEAAELIYFMISQAQNGMGMTISETPAEQEAVTTDAPSNGGNGGNGSNPEDPAELQEYILTAVPEVNAAAAKAMLERFGSLRAIFAASPKDLTAIPGIGPKKAKKIAAFFVGTRD